MTSARHRQVPAGTSRRHLRVLLPATAAVLVAGSLVAVAAGAGDDAPAATVADPAPTTTVRVDPADSPYLADRTESFSRSAKRVTLQEKPEVQNRLFMTAPLNLWPAPREKGRPLAVLKEGRKVSVTGVRRAGFARILFDDQVRWVNAQYLAHRMPKPPVVHTKSASGSRKVSGSRSEAASTSRAASASSGGISTAPCAAGSSIESGITARAVAVYRAVCAEFPQITSYGGWRGDGEHSDGRAIDIMVSGATGQAVADWLRAHSSTLGLYDIIWAQRIWTLQRSSEGWRAMSDRGSTTANHYDHVHVKVL